MGEELNTSPSGSATPTDGTPATGNNASGGATPPTAPGLTLEEAIKKIADLEHKQFNATEELERHRDFRAKYDKRQAEAEAAKKSADEAQLSEIERVKKQHAEAEQRVKTYQQQLATAQVRMAAQAKGIIDPELAALAIQGSLEYGEDGMPANVDKALDALLKSKPYLGPKPAEPPATPAPTGNNAPTVPARPAAPALPAMNPGRTQIAPPTQVNPGKPVRLADLRRRQ